jgi:hypothetical protein
MAWRWASAKEGEQFDQVPLLAVVHCGRCAASISASARRNASSGERPSSINSNQRRPLGLNLNPARQGIFRCLLAHFQLLINGAVKRGPREK